MDRGAWLRASVEVCGIVMFTLASSAAPRRLDDFRVYFSMMLATLKFFCVVFALAPIGAIAADTPPSGIESVPDRMLQEAKADVDAGKFDAALSKIDEAAKVETYSIKASLLRAQVLWVKGDRGAYFSEIDRLIKRAPNNSDAWASRGDANCIISKYASAVLDYSNAIELSKENSILVNNRGLAYYRLNEFEQAIRDYTTAIKLNPSVPIYHDNRGTAYVAKGDLDEAVRDYSSAIELKKDFAQAYNNRGVAKKTMGDLAGSIADLNQAIKIDPASLDAYANRGHAFFLRGKADDFEKAVADLNKAVAGMPSNVPAWVDRGDAKLALGDLAGASDDYQAAISLDPKESEGYDAQEKLAALRRLLEH